MEILRKNFAEELPNILTAIEEADFISFDYEFTGLFTEKEVGITDTHAERYERYRKQCVKFLPLQAGICTFKYDEKDKCYHYHPYSFYLFPHSSDQLRMSPRVFLLDGSSIDFLVKHKFDFNKSFYEGIGFGNLNDIETKKLEIEKRFTGYIEDLKSVSEPSMKLPDNMKQFLNKKVQEVKDFLAKNPEKDEELVFPDLNGYERKLLFTFLPVRVCDDPHKFTIESRYSDSGGSAIVVKANLEGIDGKVKLLLDRQQQQIENLEMAMGFSKVVQALSRSKAILIGHNQSIDLMHTLHHCIAPLPETYNDYKEFVTTTFPKLLDTKYLAHSKFQELVPNTTLGVLYETVKGLPFRKIHVVPVDEKYDMITDDVKLHDGSFDAFITGFSLLAMLDFITYEKKVELTMKNAELILKRYFHKIPMMNAIGVSHMNLGGPDEIINRENVYFINFPASWRSSDIHHALKAANVDSSNIYIHWVDDTSAWLNLKGEVDHNEVMKLTSPDSKFRVSSFTNCIAQSQRDDQINTRQDGCNEEPSAKRKKVDNGTTWKVVAKDGDTSSDKFEVPNDW